MVQETVGTIPAEIFSRSYVETVMLLPVVTLMLGLALFVWLDAYLRKEHKKKLYIICGLVLILVAQNYLDYCLAQESRPTLLRTIGSMAGYILRPAILGMFLSMVHSGKFLKLDWALIGLNTAVYLTAPFSSLTFRFSEENHYIGGPLKYTCMAVSMLLFAHLFYLTMRHFYPRERKETWIPVIVAVILATSLVLDGRISTEEQPLSYLTIGIVISSLFYYVWLHLQFAYDHEQALEAGLRVQMMISQIRPHFLHNALTVIVDLCDRDPKKAKAATVKFSRYLRGNLEAIDQMEAIPFRQELEHTRLYLDIEKLRFGDDLQVQYDIACTDFTLPALSLEPLAENAVRHGIREKPEGRGTVTIASRETAEAYEVIVTDDGPGFDSSGIGKDGKKHVGISNTRERLERICGGTLEFRTAENGETAAVMRIPKGKGS